MVAALAWSPGRLGNEAYAGVSPAVLAALLLVALTMAFLIVLALRGWREVRKREVRLDAALTNMSQGLCMFDAEGELVIANPRFAEIYRVPPETFKPGMTIAAMLALGTGPDDIDPQGTLALAQQYTNKAEPASMVQHLTDGRSVAINYRPTPDRGFVATFEDITERRLAEEKIRHLAHHDALTDLLNRAAFHERMQEVLSHRRRAESIGVLSLDLDNFKSVNDTLGHPVGDLLLQTAADRMRSCVRGEDIVARLGGDEFAIVQVPSEQPQDASALAARLVEAIGAPYSSMATRWCRRQRRHRAGPGGRRHADDLDEERRHRALPGQGRRPRPLAFLRGRDGRAHAGAGAASSSTSARPLVNGEFELDYQPIVDLGDGPDHRLRGTAALASSRTRHGSAGRLHPGRGRDRPDRAARRMGHAARPAPTPRTGRRA